ncbi:phage tail sheath family protein [Paenibacillus tuaregi]|uniref:phage tail sheath family protein n=1 Tax=Paenibacillus tuaregi TaxID=1816681 RepID=UPI00083954AE|nr:phage tail sheath family protein [Paenibacillus tuaregi]
MAGGNWSTTEGQVLPGLYMNFEAAAASAIQPGSRGTVVIPVKANWGPVREFVEIGSEAAIREVFTSGDMGGATAFTSLYLALLGGPKKLLAYRLADSTAAPASLTLQDGKAEVLKLEAKYPGSRANQFKVTVQPSLGDSSVKEMKLYENTTLLYTFGIGTGQVDAVVDALNQHPSNKWVTAVKLAESQSPLANVTDTAFTGGVSGISGVKNSDYIEAQNALETREFDVLSLDGVTDTALLQSFAAWLKRVRKEGKKAIAVFGGAAADDNAADAASKAAARSALFNHEGIVNVGTGVVFGGTEYSSAQTAAYVAGLIAGQKLNESTTYSAAPFEDVTRRWTRSEQEVAVKNGVFLLVHDGRQVKALRGVNSLIVSGTGQNSAWKKIRTIRVLDAINADLQRSAEETYIGKVNNTAEGRLALIGACKEYLRQLASSGVIESTGFNVELDPDYYGPSAAHKPEPDQVYLRWNAKLSDVMEQLFGTFYVQ